MQQDVYLAENEHGEHKIGISEYPGRRVEEIPTNTICRGEDVSLITTVETKKPRRVELQLHSLFAKHALEGEWFDLPPRAVAWLCDVERLEPRDGALIEGENSGQSKLSRAVSFLRSFTVTDDGIGFRG